MTDTFDPAIARRLELDRQRVVLALASPKRADAGRAIEAQRDAAHLPLFTAANEPRLI